MSQLFRPANSAGQRPASPALSSSLNAPSADAASQEDSIPASNDSESNIDICEPSAVDSTSVEATTEFPRISEDKVQLAESEAAENETEEEAGRRFLSDRIQRLRKRAG